MPVKVGDICNEVVVDILSNFLIEEGEVEAFPIRDLPADLGWTLPYNPCLSYCYCALPHEDSHLMPTKDHRQVCLVLKGSHALGLEGAPDTIKLGRGDLFSFNPHVRHWLYPPTPTPDNLYYTNRSSEDVYIQLDWIIPRGTVSHFMNKLKKIISDLKGFIKFSPKEEDND
tara:strand:+ start:3393 stop:3905 length:513 start_codon:yes stop_codon:yes gene_type:complete